MSAGLSVERDERTVAVENASYRWSYLVVTYALLVDVMWRSLAYKEASWDLMALVVVSGVVCTFYQARWKILSHGWITMAILAFCIGAVIAAVVVIAL
jgi:hypothetical protein